MLGLGGSAARTVGPVAVQPGHAPLHALSVTGEAAILQDGVVHGSHLAIVAHDIGAAKPARNIVRLPRPERRLVAPAVTRDPQLGIPVHAFLFPELAGD